jgi:uncharacterized protein YoxC
MNYVELVLIISVVFVTLSITIGTIYLIITLIQVKKTTRELESIVRKINTELDTVNKLSGKITSIIEKLSSPILSAVSVFFYVLSGITKRKNKCREEENE